MSKIEVLKFSANWCSPCKALSKELEGLDFKEIDVDLEENVDLAVKYKIRTIPTLIFLKDGEEVLRTGKISKKEYLEKLDELK